MNTIEHREPRLPVRWIARVILGILVAFAPRAQGAEGDDQIWLVSTRRVPLYPSEAAAPLEYWRLDAQASWLPTDEPGFLSSQSPGEPLCVFVHGNRTAWQEAIDAGALTYRQLKALAGPQSLRLVIWSWPSDRVVKRYRPDSQEKAQRSDGQSVYLAEWLERLAPEVPVTLVGYSFGARIVTGAMHLWGGGELDGLRLAPRIRPPRAAIRAVLVAAALDSDWLLPGRRNGLALGQLDHVLITGNPCDNALKWYPLLNSLHGPQALGCSGLAAGWPCVDVAKIEQIDVQDEVGKVHDWARYLRAPSLLARLPWYAFLRD
jgi:hypothetical protein